MGAKITQKLLQVTTHEEHPYGILLECCQDKAGIIENGLENPFVQDVNYPLPPICYFLIYSETDSNSNTRMFARLFQIYEDSVDSIIARCGILTGKLTDTSMAYEWDVLAAYDEDNMQKEAQIQRPEFFAKPRPKLIAKKRQALDLKALKKPQDNNKGVKGSPRKSSTALIPASLEPAVNKPASKASLPRKASADTWELENKNIMKRRVWDKVLKRGFDKRSQQTKLIYQHIYQSIQYVFRRTIKDEEVDIKVMDQVIEAHLQFYDDMNKLIEGV
ncbi:hypothetical protein BX666DRAFT_271640 [Dichotomocladium elegans]|nr:hypothetical protein BX666DRAFT_271640 [Dichotomocladium elegans]